MRLPESFVHECKQIVMHVSLAVDILHKLSQREEGIERGDLGYYGLVLKEILEDMEAEWKDDLA